MVVLKVRGTAQHTTPASKPLSREAAAGDQSSAGARKTCRLMRMMHRASSASTVVVPRWSWRIESTDLLTAPGFIPFLVGPGMLEWAADLAPKQFKGCRLEQKVPSSLLQRPYERPLHRLVSAKW